MYRVIKLLNNNVAVVRTEDKTQAIIMGPGIAFQKRKGDLIHPENVEKIFTLKNEESQHNFSTLLKDIPLDFITTSYEIIENAITKFSYPVQEYLYVTLTDHIYLSYKNIEKGSYENSSLPEIRNEYPIEYKIGEAALSKIKERLDIDFPKDEIGRIALHFINAKGLTIHRDENNGLEKQITELVQKELSKHGIVRNKENQNYYDRLMIHLNYFLERISDREQDKNQFSEKFEVNLQDDYPDAYKIGYDIHTLISDRIGKTLSDSERVYLAIHIQRLL